MNNKNSIELCQNIKDLREFYGISKKSMSKLLGISTKSLTILENGYIPKRMSVNIIIRICNIFNIMPSFILKDLKTLPQNKS